MDTNARTVGQQPTENAKKEMYGSHGKDRKSMTTQHGSIPEMAGKHSHGMKTGMDTSIGIQDSGPRKKRLEEVARSIAATRSSGTSGTRAGPEMKVLEMTRAVSEAQTESAGGPAGNTNGAVMEATFRVGKDSEGEEK